MFEIIGFYFGIVSKIFTIYLFLEIFPGVSYLAFMSATVIMGFLLSFIFHNIKDEYDYKWKRYQQGRWQRTYRENKARDDAIYAHEMRRKHRVKGDG